MNPSFRVSPPTHRLRMGIEGNSFLEVAAMDKTIASVDRILAEAVEIAAPAERQAFLDRACAGNADLRGQVEQLIANHFRAGSFLERPRPSWKSRFSPPMAR